MRNNQPVTQQEYPLTEETVLISRSDLKGNVTYANPTFVEVSGYSRDELIGAPHNIIRHPDMPEAAFADLWKTLKSGTTWQGLVKNRRKNGDHYWVHATLAPLRDGDRIVGYTSVRRKASPKAVAKAEKIYAEMREKGKSRHYTLVRGTLRRKGLTGMLSRFRVTSLRAKLIGMVAAALLLLGLAGGLGIYGLMVSGERLDTLSRSGLDDVANLQRIEQTVGQVMEQLEPAVRNPRSVEADEMSEALMAELDSIRLSWDEYRADEDQSSEVIQSFGNALDNWSNGVDQATTALVDGNGFGAFEALNDVAVPSARALREQVSQLVQSERALAADMLSEAQQGRQQMVVAQLVLMGLGALVMIGLSMLILKSVMRSLAGARYITFQIAAGNLAARERRQTGDELGELLYSLDTMRFSLSGIVGDVESRVSVVTPAVQQIAAENEELASRTEQQASSLQETASSMEEMTSTVQQNTDNARQASELAVQNARSTQQTGEQMQQLVERMQRIAQSAEKMTEMISVIDGIAFQTNILALNASVEAARAGEHGRGFAVVASEVRNLAGRSAEAAQEIRRMIDSTTQEVTGGRSAVEQAEKAIDAVMHQVNRVSELMESISTASSEQSSGIGQINAAIAEMDNVTQQNATKVQSIAASADNLALEAFELANVVDAFRLEGAQEESIKTAREHLSRMNQATDKTAKALPNHSSSSKQREAQSVSADQWDEF
ncbi:MULTISPECIES: methyl-accepting chemotaxis protein [unclassified Halomonas]|uniref:methyl-accepting chemotaxis protein n=1 Tax=unclassified Halomonas TaxID=2609666 RepID=UPI0006DB4A84|nr:MULTISPECIES: PAS domain-containing methyl-accepting chemotaxis protein [unclassified Halomonas]KPQ21060.1 MAG: chemotaxis sensory transduction system methyl-accepting chemotaxis protein with PAS sensory domain [Halomonas sp. HL-93]SBR50021.1 methyl-accepting chemotaxis sensory transducer with Pas/Pac sensor [Halomonas sp. HL-93]SNY96642.1 methyl-accepting chemotaxis sensory transducer with Pas/Pac sensor [Halomonas sp. hl-4]